MSDDPRHPDFLKGVDLRRPLPLKHMKMGGGLLPDTIEAAALWHFLLCATQALDKVPAQATLEGDADQTIDLMQLANSSRKLFGLADLNGMFNVFLVVTAKNEAKRSGLPWNPQFDPWFLSAGRNNSVITRDPDQVGQR